MKYLVIGDPHFSAGNEEETRLLEEEVDRVIEEEQPDEVVLLGDVSDRYERRSNCRAKEWITRLSSTIPVTLLVGNHERPDNMDYHSRIHDYVGMEREGLRIVAQSIRVGDVIYVPYVRPGMFQTSLNSAGGLKGVKWIFAHQSFVGCGEPTAIDKWENNIKVVSGHIHTRMSLQKGERQANILGKGWNVYYPGSSTCTTFLDTHDRVVAIVEGDMVREVPIKAYKRRVMQLTPNFTEEDLTNITSSDGYTQLVIKGTYAECAEMRNTDLVRDAENRGCVIKTIILDEGEVFQPVTHTVTRPFHQEVLSKMSSKWTADELSYLSRVMRGDAVGTS